MKPIFAPLCAIALLTTTLGSCISFGSKPPASLLTLSADSSVAAGNSRTGAVGSAVIVDLPEAARKLDNLRVPVQIDDSSLAYLKDAQWVDRPSNLFRALLSETIAARTGRLVLDREELAGQSKDRLSGQLVNFGYDVRSQQVVVTFDAVRRTGDNQVEKRRFEAREPVADATAAPVSRALNTAANKVAVEITDWLG